MRMRWVGTSTLHADLGTILGLFGGMGSMSDWVISSRNHHKVEGENTSLLNNMLEALRIEVFDLVNSLLDSTVDTESPSKRSR